MLYGFIFYFFFRPEVAASAWGKKCKGMIWFQMQAACLGRVARVGECDRKRERERTGREWEVRKGRVGEERGRDEKGTTEWSRPSEDGLVCQSFRC